MKMRRMMALTVSSLAVASTVLLAGCGTKEEAEVGTLTLSVNPEIQIAYTDDGQAASLVGQNNDGKAVVEAYPDYVGKDCGDVLKDLIVEIDEEGFFDKDIDGNKRNVVLQLEPGSKLPSDDFLENMNGDAAAALKELGISSDVVLIDDDDYDDAYDKEGEPSHYITLAKAKEIALNQANVSAKDAVFDDKEFDHDDGTPVFELEFTANGVEYEYNIHAVTGKVLKAEHKTVAVKKSSSANYSANRNYNSYNANYGNSDYGPNSDGVTDYGNSDYGPNSDGVTDYGNSDYGPNSDGVTDYNSGNSNYGNSGYDGDSDYDD